MGQKGCRFSLFLFSPVQVRYSLLNFNNGWRLTKLVFYLVQFTDQTTGAACDTWEHAIDNEREQFIKYI